MNKNHDQDRAERATLKQKKDPNPHFGFTPLSTACGKILTATTINTGATKKCGIPMPVPTVRIKNAKPGPPRL